MSELLSGLDILLSHAGTMGDMAHRLAMSISTFVWTLAPEDMNIKESVSRTAWP